MPFGTITLNDGRKIPEIAFGTGSVWKYQDVTEYVIQALDTGFSHIDTAQWYRNEESVGKALKETGVARQDFWITTKYKGTGGARKTLVQSLKELGLEFVDLYLIHNPADLDQSLEEVWAEFEQIRSEGLAKSIGVSNTKVIQLQQLMKHAKITPAVNQVSFNPYNYSENLALLEFAAKYGIVIEGYSSLAPITKYPNGAVDEPVNLAAKRLNATPAQVIFSWVRSKGVLIVTTSSKKSRLEEYLGVFDLPPLTKEEIAAIDKAGAEGPSAWSTILDKEVVGYFNSVTVPLFLLIISLLITIWIIWMP